MAKSRRSVGASFLPRMTNRLGQFLTCLIAYFAMCGVQALMLGVGQGDQILGSVIVLDSIDVVHGLIWAQSPAISLLPNKSMLKHVSLARAWRCVRIGMIRCIHKHIAAMRRSALESGMAFARLQAVVPTRVPQWVSDICAAFAVRVCRDFSLLSTATLTQTVRWVIGWWRYTLLCLAGDVSLASFWRVKLMTRDEPQRRTLPLLALKQLPATTFTLSHLAAFLSTVIITERRQVMTHASR